MPIFHRSLLLAVLVMSHVAVTAQTTRVLFVGNSFTSSNDLPLLVRNVALSMGDTVETAMVTPGGMTFQQHTTHASTQSAIAQGNWDFVVLQEQSQLPSFPPGQVEQQVLPFATQLVQQVRNVNSCTEAVFLMTWGRENGDAQNCAAYPPLCTYEGMQQRLRDSYVLMAQQNASTCAPAGMAWATQRQLDPGLQLYAGDGSHPAMTGSYLAAVTLYTTLFRRHCVGGSTWRPGEITAQQAGTMQEIAALTVLDSLPTWNVGSNDPDVDIVVQELSGNSFHFSSTGGPWEGYLWDLGDGSTAESPTVEHAFAGEGTYTVTLTVMDPCGRSTMVAVDVLVIAAGLPDPGPATSPSIHLDGGVLVIDGAGTGSTIQLLDPLGRLIHQVRVNGSGPLRVPIDNQGHGVRYWRMVLPRGGHFSGRVVAQ